MTKLQELIEQYWNADPLKIYVGELSQLRAGLKQVDASSISSAEDARQFLSLVGMLRKALLESDRSHGDNYIELLSSLLSVGEDGLYSNNLRFIFELIQNVDDCDYPSPEDCHLEMFFNEEAGTIVLKYNECGFTPQNVFAITGTAEAAKNVKADREEIGEKGIGFKSVFGVADKVWIQSGWFSFELYKAQYSIPVPCYTSDAFIPGTIMTLFVGGKVRDIYQQIKKEYYSEKAVFSRNPILFLNRLTSLKLYCNQNRYMEFNVSYAKESSDGKKVTVENGVVISVQLRDEECGTIRDDSRRITCTRYLLPVTYSREACVSRYGENTNVGLPDGKHMNLQMIFPDAEYIDEVKNGALYSFLPTQMKLTVPVVCHVPFKLSASRETVDSQGGNLWFIESCQYLSRLLDAGYNHYCKFAKEKIVYYLPHKNESIFAGDYGGEENLRRLQTFRGSHFVKLKVFYTDEMGFVDVDSIFCFSKNENVIDPGKVKRLLKLDKALFIPPEGCTVENYGVHVEQYALKKLFQRAVEVPSITEEALDYINSCKYVADAVHFFGHGDFVLTGEQICCFSKYPDYFKLLRDNACAFVQQKLKIQCSVNSGKSVDYLVPELRKSYPNFSLSDLEGADLVIKYLEKIEYRCVFLDVDETRYLPCQNALVLSSREPMKSFLRFCSKVDREKTEQFVLKSKLRMQYVRLKKAVKSETGSPSAFLKIVKDIREIEKEALGENYRNYIRLILESGNSGRNYIQEILQNADDCEYSDDVIPTFSWSVDGDKVIAEYNEKGFTRENLAAITSIGVSTKRLLDQLAQKSIGEKGIGFKSVFAIAREVQIHSGPYYFCLEDKEPTVPKCLETDEEDFKGTCMSLALKDSRLNLIPSENDILRLCLCLRKLRKIRFGEKDVIIEDQNEYRTISVDSQAFVFRKFVHCFTVSGEVLEERLKVNPATSVNQMIVCYYPEKNNLKEYYLYNGLPTQHRMNNHLVVDAPFVLTTSRESIQLDERLWNDQVRKEMYTAIKKIMVGLKSEKRDTVLGLIPVLRQGSGKTDIYENNMTDCAYLNHYPILDELKNLSFLPTMDYNIFVSPADSKVNRWPDALRLIVNEKRVIFLKNLFSFRSMLDVSESKYAPLLNALGVYSAGFESYLIVLRLCEYNDMQKESFRNRLYGWLKDISLRSIDQIRLCQLPLIPVYRIDKENETRFVAWSDLPIYVKHNTFRSTKEYGVLNEQYLSKTLCERIFGVVVNEMSRELEAANYNKHLVSMIKEACIADSNAEHVYKYLLQQFKNGNLQYNESRYVLLGLKDSIPLKNELGDVVTFELFISDKDTGYFPTEMIQGITVHKECRELADFLNISNLSGIHYEDLGYDEMLTADDIESLQDSYFVNGDEILRQFYKEGLVPDELCEEYDLGYLSINRQDEEYDVRFYFPSDPVIQRSSLLSHIIAQINNPIEIISVPETVYVKKGKNRKGEIFSLQDPDGREGVLNMYDPQGRGDYCFCQMCQKQKYRKMIEVNSIELEPKYYFPQMRLALCLECSKTYKEMRHNNNIREEFISRLKKVDINSQGTIEVPIYLDYKIKFTAKHMLQIQEILKRMK